MISVVILGAGNVATHLFKAFHKAKEVSVVQWYNRSLDVIKPYQDSVEVTDDLITIKDADVYILAVSDDVISELSSKLPFENRLVVHTSGSVSIYDLDKNTNVGCFIRCNRLVKMPKWISQTSLFVMKRLTGKVILFLGN